MDDTDDYIKPSRTKRIKHLDHDSKSTGKKVHRVGKERESEEHVPSHKDWVRYYEEESGTSLWEELDEDTSSTGDVQ